ncbi:hypothetical protein C8J56DRAFT_921003 [Mycena floridula]|nr:hypothetical protein C8J56DRAFT_921003 [Mycena floridula]
MLFSANFASTSALSLSSIPCSDSLNNPDQHSVDSLLDDPPKSRVVEIQRAGVLRRASCDRCLHFLVAPRRKRSKLPECIPVAGDSMGRCSKCKQQNQACTWTGVPKSSTSRAAPGTRRGPKLTGKRPSISSDPYSSESPRDLLSPTGTSTSSSDSVSTEYHPDIAGSGTKILGESGVKDGPTLAYPSMHAILSGKERFWHAVAEAVSQGAESTFRPSGFPPLGANFDALMQYRQSVDDARKTCMATLMTEAYKLGRSISDVEFYNALIEKSLVPGSEVFSSQTVRDNLAERHENIEWLHRNGLDNAVNIVIS